MMLYVIAFRTVPGIALEGSVGCTRVSLRLYHLAVVTTFDDNECC